MSRRRHRLYHSRIRVPFPAARCLERPPPHRRAPAGRVLPGARLHRPRNASASRPVSCTFRSHAMTSATSPGGGSAGVDRASTPATRTGSWRSRVGPSAFLSNASTEATYDRATTVPRPTASTASLRHDSEPSLRQQLASGAADSARRDRVGAPIGSPYPLGEQRLCLDPRFQQSRVPLRRQAAVALRVGGACIPGAD